MNQEKIYLRVSSNDGSVCFITLDDDFMKLSFRDGKELTPEKKAKEMAYQVNSKPYRIVVYTNNQELIGIDILENVPSSTIRRRSKHNNFSHNDQQELHLLAHPEDI